MLKYEEYLPESRNESLWNFYVSFIESLKDRILSSDTYTERHHIVPKSYIPKEFWKDKSNTIVLTGSEHFIVHYILYLTFKDYAMSCAIKKMTESCGQNGTVDWLRPDVYERLRKDWAKLHSEKIGGRSNPKLKEYYAKYGAINQDNHWIFRVLEDGSIKRRQQHKDLPCPDGWTFGKGPSVACSEDKKRKISESLKKSHPTPKNKGERGIHRILEDGSIERKYINSSSPLPDGWMETTGPHGVKNIKEYRKRIYIFRYNNKGERKLRYIHEGEEIPIGWQELKERKHDKKSGRNKENKCRTLF